MGKEFEEEEEDEHKRKKRSTDDGDGADEDEVLIDLMNLFLRVPVKILSNPGSNSRVNHTTGKPDDKRQAGQQCFLDFSNLEKILTGVAILGDEEGSEAKLKMSKLTSFL